MPPRKSDLSKSSGATDEAANGTPSKSASALSESGINVEDLNLPKSIVTRLAKGVLPANTQIQGNAMLAMTKSATVFVNYLATHANEHAQGANRKTVAPADVFKALEDLEFSDFKPRLEAELAKFNEVQTVKRNTYRKKVAEGKAKSGSEGVERNGEDGEGGDGERATKKARTEGGGAGEEMMPEGEETEEEVEDEAEAGAGEEDEDDGEQGAEEESEGSEEAVEEEGGDAEVEDEALDNGEDSD